MVPTTSLTGAAGEHFGMSQYCPGAPIAAGPLQVVSDDAPREGRVWADC